MKKLRTSLLIAAILLVGCDHHKPDNQAQAEAGSAAVAQDDSELTGLPPQSKAVATKPAYPRAQPVTLPATTPTSPAISESTRPVAATPPPTEAPPPEPPPAPVPATPPPAPADDTSPSRLTLTSTNPEPATNLPAPAPDTTPQEQVVVLKTSLGNIVIELDNAAAPVTCENFRKLVSDGFYNHTVFHRVIPDFIIQGGDPNSKSDNRASYGQGGPDYKLPAEIKLTHDLGAVAMARLPDSVNPRRESNGSQFYICLEACPSLDAKYTVFGHVIKGMDVANKIGSEPRDSRDNPLDRIEMQAILETKNEALANDAGNP
jgi:cyclophilin family peptidyl-prolyl cis-trans isomerase